MFYSKERKFKKELSVMIVICIIELITLNVISMLLFINRYYEQDWIVIFNLFIVLKFNVFWYYNIFKANKKYVDCIKDNRDLTILTYRELRRNVFKFKSILTIWIVLSLIYKIML